MNIGVLGTGIVGKTLAGKLIQLGHHVMMGSRSATGAAVAEWAEAAGDSASAGTFMDAATFGEVVVNATAGAVALEVLESCGDAALDGKVLVDVSNPLDFSAGFPPSLSTSSSESLGELIQAAHPGARVVKSLNTVSAPIMVQPSLVPGHHSMFVCGNDSAAKAEVVRLLESLGWPAEDVIDLGDITGSRGLEMYLPLWLRLFGVVGTPAFNVRVVRA